MVSVLKLSNELCDLIRYTHYIHTNVFNRKLLLLAYIVSVNLLVVLYKLRYTYVSFVYFFLTLESVKNVYLQQVYLCECCLCMTCVIDLVFTLCRE